MNTVTFHSQNGNTVTPDPLKTNKTSQEDHEGSIK